jgi:outer membrane protein assembly factor BamB
MLKKSPIWPIALLSLLLLLASCASAPSVQTAPPPPSPTTSITTPATSLVAWPAFDGGSAQTGINTVEHTITTANVGQLTRLWQTHLPNTADSSPIFLPNVATSAGPKALLFLTTLNGSLLALDAATGKTVWSQATHGPKITTSSPALDPTGHFVYSYGLDGKVHKYAVGNGAEMTGAGWPEPVTLMNEDEKESSALNITKDYLYVTISGYNGDAGHYQGHTVAIQLATGTSTVFNSLCSNIRQLLVNTSTSANYCQGIQSGIWARAGAVVDPVTGNVFFTTGNGPYDANNGGHNYGDSVIELSPDLNNIIDTYTPTNHNELNQRDEDLGSASPVMLPKQAASNTPYIAIQAGKDEKLRVLNRQNLSGQGGPNHVGGELQSVALPQGCGVLTQPVAWNDASGTTWVFVVNSCGLSTFKVLTNTNGQTSLQVAYTNQASGSSPFIANGILFIQGNHILRALNPNTGTTLWSSNIPSAGGSIGNLHWESPIVVNGVVYVPDDDGALTAYSLPPT